LWQGRVTKVARMDADAHAVDPRPPAARRFRPRPGQAAPSRGGLFDRLSGEWAELVASGGARAAARHWAAAYPCLAGAPDLAGLLDRIDRASAAESDALLLALIRLTHSGQQLAGRAVLQAMLPKLARMRWTGARGDERGWRPDEAEGHLVGAFWEVLMTYPTARRPRKVAANLALDTLRAVTTTRHPTRELPVADADTVVRAAVTDSAPVGGPGATIRDEAWALLQEAARDRLVPPDVVRFLATVHLLPVEQWGDDLTAMSPEALRQRRSRATRRLRAAVRAA
jgi:hypothetical protein